MLMDRSFLSNTGRLIWASLPQSSFQLRFDIPGNVTYVWCSRNQETSNPTKIIIGGHAISLPDSRFHGGWISTWIRNVIINTGRCQRRQSFLWLILSFRSFSLSQSSGSSTPVTFVRSRSPSLIEIFQSSILRGGF